MRIKETGERVNGPYKHGKQWRLVVVMPQPGGRSRQVALTYPTRRAAIDAKEEWIRQAEGRTVTDAVKAHLRDLSSQTEASTAERATTHLRRFFQLDGEAAEPGGRSRRVPFGRTGGLLCELTPKRCQTLYEALRTGTHRGKPVAVATQHGGLAAAKAFLGWCVGQGWLKTNPVAHLKAEGTKGRRKQQLRINEARRWTEAALELARAGDDGAVAALAALLLGVRASEITDRVVRDLDDNGRLLWIDRGKTRNAERFLEVPGLLRPYLLALATGRRADEPLFSRTRGRKGKPRDRHWVLRSVRRVCRQAGVPTVCAHSLRGLHSTLAQEAGVTGHLVAGALTGQASVAAPPLDVDRQTAAQLGHGSPATTHGHYTAPGAVERARVARANLRLVPEPTGSAW